MYFRAPSAPALSPAISALLSAAAERPDSYLFEFEAYELFNQFGLKTPQFGYFALAEDGYRERICAFMRANQQYVFKCHIPGCLHKTDINGVELFVNRQNCAEKLDAFVSRLPDTLEGVIVVEMADYYTKTPTNGELLLSAVIDSAFGPVVCYGLGGTAVEQLRGHMPESVLFIPAGVDVENSPNWRQRIENAPATQYLTGKIRGVPKQCYLSEILGAIRGLQDIISYFFLQKIQIAEIEINPAVISKTGQLLALDGVVRVRRQGDASELLSEGQERALKPLFKTGLFFAPQSVLLAGASAKSLTNPCTVVLTKFLELQKTQKIDLYCIHPTASDIMGVRCFKSLSECRQSVRQIDLFVCGVAAKAAYEMLAEIIDSGYCHTSFILSAGFGETEQGKALEQSLRERLDEKTKSFPDNKFYPLMNGANTLGYLWQSKVNTVFIDSRKSSSYDNQNQYITNVHKNAALICQSGAFMISRLSDLANRVAPVMSMSVGNQIDMSATDFLEWLLDEHSAEQYESQFGEERPALRELDAEKGRIRVYGLYIEGLNKNDGVRLLKLIQKCRDRQKLVYVYKTGRTAQGAHAAAGHTASLSGSYSMFKQLVETSGAVCTDSLSEFEDSLFLATCAVDKLGCIQNKLKLGIVTNAGFEKCMYADHLFMPANSENYLELPVLSEENRQKLIKLYAEYKLSAVIDIDQILDTTPTIPDDAYYKFAQVLLDECGAVVISPVPETHMISSVTGECGKLVGRDFMQEENSIPKLCVRLAQEQEKLIVVTVESGWKYDAFRRYCIANGICVFEHADQCSKALNNLARAWLGWWRK